MKNWPIEQLKQRATPYYFYDLERLSMDTMAAKKAAEKYHYQIHYAVKANHEPKIMAFMKNCGFGVDCVSENELHASLNMGFEASQILLAGVGKTDKELELAIYHNIKAIHAESLEELEVIDEIAGKMNRVAKIAIRINPNVNANTHPGITTGLNENKFGISQGKFEELDGLLPLLKNIKIIGLHFHIGSQILELNSFKELADSVNLTWSRFLEKGYSFTYLNLGGGLGIDYHEPDGETAAFDHYFALFNRLLDIPKETKVHFELGRSLVGQCGSLISKVLYVKKGEEKEFLILDAGMTELIRPALYNSYHQVDVLNNTKLIRSYDIVGPVCESSDLFAKQREMKETKRNDIAAIRSAGAYGQVMSSNYNLRPSPDAVFSDDLTPSVDRRSTLVF